MLLIIAYTFILFAKHRFTTKTNLHAIKMPDSIPPHTMNMQLIPLSDTPNPPKTLLEKYIIDGNDMRPSNGTEEQPSHIALLHEKFEVLQQLNSNQISLLEKIEKIRCDYRHIVHVGNEINEIQCYSIRAGGLMDQWNA
jgi:hypothetical protein